MLKAVLFALYTALLVAACVASLRSGGLSEKRGAVIVAGATLLSTLVGFGEQVTFETVNVGLAAVDVMAWVMLLDVALTSKRWWPLWATAFQSNALLTHAAVWAKPAFLPEAYAHTAGFWAWPILVALLLGAVEERRRGHRGTGSPISVS